MRYPRNSQLATISNLRNKSISANEKVGSRRRRIGSLFPPSSIHPITYPNGRSKDMIDLPSQPCLGSWDCIEKFFPLPSTVRRLKCESICTRCWIWLCHTTVCSLTVIKVIDVHVWWSPGQAVCCGIQYKLLRRAQGGNCIRFCCVIRRPLFFFSSIGALYLTMSR